MSEAEPDRDALLGRLNAALAPVEAELVRRFEAPRWPVCFVVGAPRAGHTLLSQLLARSGSLAYVNNVVARFWDAPLVGAMVDRVLPPEDAGPAPEAPRSEYGRTSGRAEPHEFGNFLRRWIEFGEVHRSASQTPSPETTGAWRREVAALEDFYRRPLMLRNLVYGQNVPLVRSVFPASLFVVCRREPLWQAQSMLEARARQPGGRGAWWSLRPPGCEGLDSRSPEEQVVGQIRAAQAVLERDLAALPASAALHVEYAEVCRDPRGQVRRVVQRLESLGARLPAPQLDRVPEHLESGDRPRLTDRELAALRRAAEAATARG